jgi:hypothetical protein
MTAGVAATTANGWLNTWRNTAASAVATVYVKLHVGDPGSAGTANAAAVTTRNQATWSSPSGGSMALSTLSAYSMTTAETISHISFWDASSAGNFLGSAALSSSKTVANGDTLTFTTLTVAVSPIAA